jgi:hypothetical protein
MRVGPGGKLRDDVDLAKELSDHLTGVVALAKRVKIGKQPLERILGLGDGDVGVVLPLPFEMPMMFEQFFAKEIAETLTAGPAERNVQRGNLDSFEATLGGH